MVISRAEIYWADLGPPSGSQPAKRRPVLVIQSDPYNASRLATVIAAVIDHVQYGAGGNARQRVLARDHNATAT